MKKEENLGEAEARTQAIVAETEDWKTNPDEGSTWHGKFNNYHCYLPSDYYSDEGGRQMGLFVNRAGMLDKVNSETHSEENPYHHSELFMSQTPRELFAAIDQAVADQPDVSLDEINRLQRKHYEIPSIRMYQNMPPEEERLENEKIDRSMDVLRELYEYTLPVYIDLRVMGYSHFDLTG